MILEKWTIKNKTVILHTKEVRLFVVIERLQTRKGVITQMHEFKTRADANEYLGQVAAMELEGVKEVSTLRLSPL